MSLGISGIPSAALSPSRENLCEFGLIFGGFSQCGFLALGQLLRSIEQALLLLRLPLDFRHFHVPIFDHFPLLVC